MPRFEIHYTLPDGTEDYFIVEGEPDEELREYVRREVERRGGTDGAWRLNEMTTPSDKHPTAGISEEQAAKAYRDMTGPEMLTACGDDAVKWAAAFCDIWPGAMDEDTMIAWFANAIEHSSDVRAARRAALEAAATPESELTSLRAALKEAVGVMELIAGQGNKCLIRPSMGDEYDRAYQEGSHNAFSQIADIAAAFVAKHKESAP